VIVDVNRINFQNREISELKLADHVLLKVRVKVDSNDFQNSTHIEQTLRRFEAIDLCVLVISVVK
jgi:hypothetical protein